MAANYHAEEPHILDYNKYPGIGSCGFLFKLVFIHVIIFCEKLTSISMVLLTDLEERQRFVLAYLSTSGNGLLQIAL